MDGIRGVLREVLSRSLKAMPVEDRLSAAWPVACGSAMAGHGEVVGYDCGLVHILVTDKEWMQQMKSMSGVLQRELGKIAGVAVSGIHYEMKSLCEENVIAKTVWKGRSE